MKYKYKYMKLQILKSMFKTIIIILKLFTLSIIKQKNSNILMIIYLLYFYMKMDFSKKIMIYMHSLFNNNVILVIHGNISYCMD